MKRKFNNSVHDKFSYDKKAKTSTCQICAKILQGKHATNLLKHLTSAHNNEYTEVMEANTKKSKLEIGGTTKLEDLSDFFSIERQTIQIRMTPAKLQSALVEMVTKNSRPLSVVEDSGLRNIIDPILSGFSGENKITINRFNIRKLITEEAVNIRRKLSKIVEKKLISIKVDIASKMDRSILGVNVQVMEESQIKTFTLAMTEIKTRSTSENLLQILNNVLESYKINRQQIYTMTTDNGTNMIKCTDLMLREQCENCDSTSEDEDYEDYGINDDEILRNIEFENSGLVSRIPCVAHTFQLAVNKFTSMKNVDKLIVKARAVAKKLRTPTFSSIIKKQNLRQPLIDCPTRWSSTFLMLERLKTLREFCDVLDEKALVISKSDWVEINKILQVLLPAHTTNKIFQTEQLTLSDIYSAWTKCKIDLTNINTTYSKLLEEAMIQKEDYLMSNPMLACLYLDRRYSIMLTDTQKQQAKNHLISVYTHKSRLLQINSSDSVNNLNLSHAPCVVAVQKLFCDNDELEIMLAKKETELAVLNLTNNKETSTTTDMNSILDSFDKTKRIPLNTNILVYWSNQKNVLPSQLYELSKIVFAVPGTQVSVERAFSSLNYILSDKRNSICGNLLEDILLVKLNKF